MELTCKNYKIKKMKHFFKKNKFSFFYNSQDFNQEKSINIYQNFDSINLTLSKLSNNMTKFLIKKSVYCNFKSIICSLIFVSKLKKNKDVKKFNFSKENIVCLILNKQLYSMDQIRNVDDFYFIFQVTFFMKFLNNKIFSIFKTV